MLQYIKAFESDEFHPCNGGSEGGGGRGGDMRRERGWLRSGGRGAPGGEQCRGRCTTAVLRVH